MYIYNRFRLNIMPILDLKDERGKLEKELLSNDRININKRTPTPPMLVLCSEVIFTWRGVVT